VHNKEHAISEEFQLRLVAKSNVPRIRSRSIVGQVVLTLLGVQLLFLASFTSLDVPIATKRNLTNFMQRQLHYVMNAVPQPYYSRAEGLLPLLKAPLQEVRRSTYTPLAAVAIFLGYVLGPIIGPAACAIFIVVGMFGPYLGVHTFAGGGGINYYLEPGFGYLLALVGAAWIAGIVTEGRRTSASQLFAVFSGLTVTHLTGLVYLLGSCLVSYLIDGSRASLAWQPWVFELARNMTWYPLPYDIISSLVFVGVGFPFRWLASTLIAPELVARAAKTSKAARSSNASRSSKSDQPKAGHKVAPSYRTEKIEEFV
jgi:biotin transport system substrate-specific component